MSIRRSYLARPWGHRLAAMWLHVTALISAPTSMWRVSNSAAANQLESFRRHWKFSAIEIVEFSNSTCA